MSCSAELSMKKSFITSGPGQQNNLPETWDNVPSDMCAQWRLAQTDKSLLCLHENTLHFASMAIHNAPSGYYYKIVQCAGWSDSSLGAHLRVFTFWRCSWNYHACLENGPECVLSVEKPWVNWFRGVRNNVNVLALYLYSTFLWPKFLLCMQMFLKIPSKMANSVYPDQIVLSGTLVCEILRYLPYDFISVKNITLQWREASGSQLYFIK